MKMSRREQKYVRTRLNEVLHTTIDPQEPGVVRIHLIPPKTDGKEIENSVVIINGQDILPVNLSWSILLGELICQINLSRGKKLSEEDMEAIAEQAIRGVHKVYPFVGRKRLKQDMQRIFHTFRQLALGEPTDEEIGYLSIGEYAPFMRAPHRMDLMISSMTRDGDWHCNQKCVHCYAAGQQQAQEKELSTLEWMKIIDACRRAGIAQVTFTGGEPTLRKDLVELVEHARWFVTRLNTNGILLTRELCDRLYAASLDSVQITFYSSDKDIHNTLVGGGHYEETLAGIENALEAGLSISINTPLCTLNRDYVRTLEFLQERGVRYVTCSGLITTGNAARKDSEALQLQKDELKEILREAAAYCFSHGMEISFTSPGWVEEAFLKELGIVTPSCGACLSNMAVTPGGNVVPCQSWLSGKILGNMLTDEWETIWNGEACEKQRSYSAQMLGVCPLKKEKGEDEA